MADQRQRENIPAGPVAPVAPRSKRSSPKAASPKAAAAPAPAAAAKPEGAKLYKGMRVGSRAQVWHGTADITAASQKGLKRADLTMNPRGHIVSKKQRAAGVKAFERLRELGYAPEAGKPFVAFTKKNGPKARDARKSRKQRDARKSRNARKSRDARNARK